ncbi:YxeA family protein [Listeria aquatica]|uniref:YxeA family protein n=2 Tax=Listeria aquatica TaxID=1494960 RepID=A0A841ZLH7_9LIST|nr:YxeA family protein [Listeria aquatica]MBC1520114.1 YxeA family protein [Listeria aquatica]
MKKLIGWILGFVVIVGLALGGAKLMTANQSGEMAGIIDRFNPLVKEEAVYVKTSKPVNVDEHGNANYKLTAVNQDGKTRTIEFMAMGELKQDRFLKLSSKGAYVETYEEVPREKLPDKAMEKL